MEVTTADSAVGGGMGGAPSGGFGGSSEVTQGDSANTISENGTYTDTTYTSTGDDENALRIDGADLTLTGDCVITSLTNNGTINFNGYTITLAGGTVLQ